MTTKLFTIDQHPYIVAEQSLSVNFKVSSMFYFKESKLLHLIA